ncbi:MAG TPA: hypothetical protein VH601_26525 [Bryobacteraceae bacterium]|jgi:hypothetical protein
MHATHIRDFQIAGRYFLVGLLAASTLAFAQETGPLQSPPVDQQNPVNSGGWKRVGDASPQAQGNNTNQYPQYGQNQSGDPNQPPPPLPQSGQSTYNQQNNPTYPPPPPVPASLAIQQGTYITVRVNEMLSSDKNQPGDAFTASLVQPLVVNGVVIAEPGQTLGGRVVSAEKHHIDTPARLGIQLINMTLVDGQQIPITTQFISRRGGTTPGGQEFGTVAATTGLGAAIGAAAGWGTGAAIGAGAGAAAGLIGVLVTHNHASVIYPEQVLTFRLEAPVTISTEHGQQAFRYVQPNEYDRPRDNGPAGPGPGAYGTAAPPPPAYYPYGYAYPYYGYYAYGYPYWGPSFAFYYGPGFWWGGHWYHSGYYGHGYYGHGNYGYGSHGYNGAGHSYAGGHASGPAVHGGGGRH